MVICLDALFINCILIPNLNLFNSFKNGFLLARSSFSRAKQKRLAPGAEPPDDVHFDGSRVNASSETH